MRKRLSIYLPVTFDDDEYYSRMKTIAIPKENSNQPTRYHCDMFCDPPNLQRETKETTTQYYDTANKDKGILREKYELHWLLPCVLILFLITGY